MARKIVAGNWKMNTSLEEGLILVSEINGMLGDLIVKADEVILGAPFTHLYPIQKRINHAKLSVAGQNCHQAEKGAYTGEISASMLASIGCKYVILGHSERRQYFGETDQLIASKIGAAFAQGLQVIYCCGETLSERENGSFFKVIEEQLKTALTGLNAAAMKNIIIAYEPVWAIGTGKTASPEQAQEIHAFIRQQLTEQFGADTAQASSILYGGSCNAQNAKELFAQADIDGGLIGGASLKSRDFVDIIQSY